MSNKQRGQVIMKIIFEDENKDADDSKNSNDRNCSKSSSNKMSDDVNNIYIVINITAAAT